MSKYQENITRIIIRYSKDFKEKCLKLCRKIF